MQRKMNKYQLSPQSRYVRDWKHVCKNNRVLSEKICKVHEKLGTNPFLKGLGTHKVSTVIGENRYSTRVTGDLRIIWEFDNNTVIILLALGGHSGSRKVYK